VHGNAASRKWRRYRATLHTEKTKTNDVPLILIVNLLQ